RSITWAMSCSMSSPFARAIGAKGDHVGDEPHYFMALLPRERGKVAAVAARRRLTDGGLKRPVS
ncbi:MAG: hypothetical protein ACK55V_14800, partial [Alphaproteobacteria bacterium]